MNKLLSAVALALTSLLIAGCTPATPTPTEKPTTVEDSPAPSPTPTAEQEEARAFGETVTLEYDGSVWEVTLNQPIDLPDRLANDFPPDRDGDRYVGIPGTITRVEGPPAEPIMEIEVGAVVENASVESEYLADNEFIAVDALPELFAGAKATFTQVFAIPEGQSISTAYVAIGEGEATERVFFGETLDLGAESTASPDVETMQYIWDQASDEQRATSMESWGLTEDRVTPEGIAQLISEGEEAGVILDETEARTFLEWVLSQE